MVTHYSAFCLFRGEIFIWDITRQDENLLYSSRIDDYFHREAISQIIWLEQKLVGKASSIYVIIMLSERALMLCIIYNRIL